MITVLVTGAAGFIGKHLVGVLARQRSCRVLTIDISSPAAELTSALETADVIYHLAGVNRPKDPAEFALGNTGFTSLLCAELEELGRCPLVVMTSSIQAELENPYGVSKRNAENVLQQWAARSGGRVAIFRLSNVFGKWCRPNYNSVIATFCHNIAHDLPIQISDPARELDLLYIDDVIDAFIAVESRPVPPGHCEFRSIGRSYRVTLGRIAELIAEFRRSRSTLELPSFADEFTRRLYATYLSYLDGSQFGYSLNLKVDLRGSLAEFIKQPHFGQVFVSRTRPGITRGNHYHHTKTEKFFVVEGQAIIRFRKVDSDEVIEHRVSGADFSVVDIPPGYVHSIENIGSTDLVTLFWASEVFDPQRPDCYLSDVIRSDSESKPPAL